MPVFGITGHHDIFRDIFLVGFVRNLLPFLKRYHSLRMSKSCGGTQNNRCIIFLTEFVSKLCKILCLLAV